MTKFIYLWLLGNIFILDLIKYYVHRFAGINVLNIEDVTNLKLVKLLTNPGYTSE